VPDVEVVVIVGSRDPAAHVLQAASAAGSCIAAKGWLVATGGARGVDMASEAGAKEAGGECLPAIEPDYKRYGKGAPIQRNGPVVAQATRYVLAYWDGYSRGTLDAIQKAARQGKCVLVNPPYELVEVLQ
jgi:SLOG-like protein